MGYSFPTELVSSSLKPQDAFEAMQAFQTEFLEQMWHDLAVQGHIHLRYQQRESFDSLLPTDLFGTEEHVLNKYSPVHQIELWANKHVSFDAMGARETATDNWLFEEYFVETLFDAAFSEVNLGFAIGKGLYEGDLQLLSSEAFENYLQEIYGGWRDYYKVELEIIGDVDWEGLRYGELWSEQQMYLATNFVSAYQHHESSMTNGVALHLLHCMAKHDRTADNVKAFIRLNLPEQST